MSYGREAKLLCKKIVSFFALLSKTQDTGVRKLGVTQDLLSLVTGLAHYLKLLIRISLQGALKLEREKLEADGLNDFLDELKDLDPIKGAEGCLDLSPESARLADAKSDLCMKCNEPVEDECARRNNERWHVSCVVCANCARELSRDLDDVTWNPTTKRLLCATCVERVEDVERGFEHVTKLQQYIYLLRVALARLLAKLRAGGTLPHTSGRCSSRLRSCPVRY